jgi:hypothetical protein
MRTRRAFSVFLAGALLSAALAVPAGAQSVGVRAGRYLDLKENFIGFELLSRIGPRTYFNPNVEYVFVENRTYLTFNLDFHLDFFTSSPLFFWLGGGLAGIYINPEGPPEGDLELGGNLMFGLGLGPGGGLVPYAQIKLILASDSQVVIGAGLRF